MDELKPTKSLTQQALEQLPENALHGKVVTEDGRTVDGKLSIQKTWNSGVGFGFFVQGKFQIGHKPQGAAGVEVKIKLD